MEYTLPILDSQVWFHQGYSGIYQNMEDRVIHNCYQEAKPRKYNHTAPGNLNNTD